MEKHWEVIVIGGGPCGIAAAAELKKRNIESLIIEKGSVTESIRRYPKRMRFFSTADNIEIASIPFATSNVKANRNEALQYYRKVALYFKLQFSLGTEALQIKKGVDNFSIETTKGTFTANKVVLATGYFDLPRKLGIPGEDGPNTNHYYEEPYAHSFQKVVIVGGGNSAIEAALELYRHDVDVTMVVRGDDIKQTAKYWLVPDIRNRIKEGKIKLITNTAVTAISEDHIHIQSVDGRDEKLPADFVYLLVGYLPNEALLKKCGLKPDPETLLVNFDQKTFESDVEGLYLCGTVLAGVRTEKVFIENGRDHAIAIANSISESVVVKS
ncbi:MAG: YpdA family putative bacillithiol disulfide reductase [Flavobacteriales bacterium]|nr:YpdA family putative bacillithiol disulfide reductase [Flavobacteriales bacterium]